MNNSDTSMDRKSIVKKLADTRTNIMFKFPFFTSLIMGLKVGLGNVETACTDMKRIIWDPAFLQRLSPEEVEFVTMHEILHCVLKHCTRGEEFDPDLYNYACDIVVNSTLLEYMGLSEFMVDGEPVFHKLPSGAEGRYYTAEQVYYMLLSNNPGGKSKEGLLSTGKIDEPDDLLPTDQIGKRIDNHNIWRNIPKDDKYLDEQWKDRLLEAVKRNKGCSLNGTAIRKLIDDYEYQAKVDWRSVLYDFVQVVYDNKDYTFSPYDRRFSNTDFILPAFNDIESEKVSNLWFVVDASGSISDDILGLAVSEIKGAMEQFDGMSGSISFFDTKVSEPIEFCDEVEFPTLEVIGGGGTSFYAIFEYMKKHMMDELPTAVIILTDGEAKYPPEEMALEVPVLWILVGASEDAPWGVSTRIEG